MIMTPGYASPEQIAGDSSGKSGDIYSVAVVLYQLLTGRLPYADKNGRPDLADQLSGHDRRHLRARRSTSVRQPVNRARTDSRKASHPDLDHVVLTALQRDPLRRYAPCRLFAEDLRRVSTAVRSPRARAGSTVSGSSSPATSSRHRSPRPSSSSPAPAPGWRSPCTWSAHRSKQKRRSFERFVALLNAKVGRWTEPQQAVPIPERVADVQSANQLMASDTLRTLSVNVPDPERLKRVVGELRRFLDRAEELSQGLPPLRKEIALVYRRIGDFESTTPRVQNKAQAAVSYRRAAAVAASIRATERSWADQRLSEVGDRLQEAARRLPETSSRRPSPPLLRSRKRPRRCG